MSITTECNDLQFNLKVIEYRTKKICNLINFTVLYKCTLIHVDACKTSNILTGACLLSCYITFSSHDPQCFWREDTNNWCFQGKILLLFCLMDEFCCPTVWGLCCFAKLTICMVLFIPRNTTFMISKNWPKCDSYHHFSALCQSISDSGPQKLAGFLNLVDIRLVFHM